jgi:transcriptional regulator with XRE-family HTH domain
MNISHDNEEVDPEMVKKAWGQAIRDQRTVLGLSQAQLAKVLGVDQSAVSWWESGAKAPGVERQVAIAAALKIHPRILFAYPVAVAS